MMEKIARNALGGGYQGCDVGCARLPMADGNERVRADLRELVKRDTLVQ